MAEQTAIAWCDSTFNPWIGCTKVSPACDHCYAERDFGQRKHRVQWGAGQPRSRTKTWSDPLKWNRKRFMQCNACGWRGELATDLIGCGACGSTDHLQDTRRRVFCASLADVFDNEVPEHWRWDLFRLIAATPHLDWLLLTKRIGNARDMLNSAAAAVVGEFVGAAEWDRQPWPNVWIGATICNQAEADRDLGKLERVPAAVHFVSIEPMLSAIDLGLMQYHDSDHTDELGRIIANTRRRWLRWVICGGESGPHARPMHPDWARSLRDQCAAAGVPFFFKQWGEWIGADQDECPCGPPASRWRWGDGTPYSFDGPSGSLPLLCRAGTKAAGRLLDCREHNEFPNGVMG